MSRKAIGSSVVPVRHGLYFGRHGKILSFLLGLSSLSQRTTWQAVVWANLPTNSALQSVLLLPFFLFSLSFLSFSPSKCDKDGFPSGYPVLDMICTRNTQFHVETYGNIFWNLSSEVGDSFRWVSSLCFGCAGIKRGHLAAFFFATGCTEASKRSNTRAAWILQ